MVYEQPETRAFKNMFKQYNLKCAKGRVSRALGADAYADHGHADQQTRSLNQKIIMNYVYRGLDVPILVSLVKHYFLSYLNASIL